MTIRADALAPGDSRTARETRRRVRAAWALSAAAHALVLAAFMASASGQIVAGDGAAPGEPMSVSVVAASSLASSGGPSTDALKPLMAKFDSPEPPVTVDPTPRHSELQQLIDRLQSGSSASPTSPTGPQHAEAAEAQAGAAGAEAARGRTPGSPGSTGGLWGAVEPCWSRLAGASPVPVTLEISLDARGRLAAPPKIVRAGGPISELRLRAEANALAALAACLPEGDIRFGGHVYRLEFRPARQAD